MLSSGYWNPHALVAERHTGTGIRLHANNSDSTGILWDTTVNHE